MKAINAANPISVASSFSGCSKPSVLRLAIGPSWDIPLMVSACWMFFLAIWTSVNCSKRVSTIF
jgi:hypothetical protein